MPNTETTNPTYFAMVKTIFLFLTLWSLTVSFDLPNVNNISQPSGKCIKANENITCPPDSNLYVVVPEFKLADPNNFRIRTVVIDPGHGGHDPGCSGHGSKEKDIVLAVGKYLSENLSMHYPNLNVMMTRSTDVFVPLHQRAALANDYNADLFISIHCNAFSNQHAHGTETYVLGLHATEENLAVAKRENESVLLEDNYQENYGFDPNSPEAHIMFSMFQNAFLEQSISFAEKVQRQASRNTGLKNRGVKQAGFLVLRRTTMPSVLIETGYLTNPKDEAYLETANGQRAMADALLDAFSEYKKDLEKMATGEAPAVVSFTENKKREVLPPPVVTKPVQTTIQNDKVVEKSIAAKTVKKETAPVIQPTAAPSKTTAPNVVPPVKEASKTTITTKVQTVGKTNISPKKGSKITPTMPVDNGYERLSDNTHISSVTTAPHSTDISKPNFCIQLAASPQLLDVSQGKWKKIHQTVEVISEGKLYKYQVRNFATFEEADRVRRDLRGKGFNDAYLVAYKNGQKVNPHKFR